MFIEIKQIYLLSFIQFNLTLLKEAFRYSTHVSKLLNDFKIIHELYAVKPCFPLVTTHTVTLNSYTKWIALFVVTSLCLLSIAHTNAMPTS